MIVQHGPTSVGLLFGGAKVVLDSRGEPTSLAPSLPSSIGNRTGRVWRATVQDLTRGATSRR